MNIDRIFVSVGCAAAWMALAAATEPAPDGEIGIITFSEPFNDPNSSTASSLAKTEGLSLMEATERLKVMNEASRLSVKLADRFPNSFSGIAASSDSSFKISVFGTASQIADIKSASLSFGSVGQLSRVIDFKVSQESARQTTARARNLFSQATSLGLDAVIASNPRTGEYKALVKNQRNALYSILSGAFKAPSGTKIEFFDGITPTAIEVVGGYGFDAARFDEFSCTRGFNVKEKVGTFYGISTAGHCGNSGTDAKTGRSLGFKKQWITNNLDSQWMTFSGSEGYLVVPKFYDGLNTVSVTGGQGDYEGLYVCKYGRTTGRTCGSVDRFQYTSTTYGDFPRVNSNSTYPQINDIGDSGGPVFVGSLAVGQVHAKDSAGNMYYTPLRAWEAASLPIGVTCYCS